MPLPRPVAAKLEPEAVLRDFLASADPAVFWQQVDANIVAGRIKLVFVADVIPRELASIVEFMNEQMKAEVRAVELRWFEGEGGTTTLAPRLIGATERAAAQKSASRVPLAPVTRETWIETNIRPTSAEAVTGAAALIELVEAIGGDVVVAKTQGSLVAQFRGADGKWFYPFHLWRSSGGYVTLSFAYLTSRPALVEEAPRRDLYDRLADVVGPLSTPNIAGYPGFRVGLLADPALAAGVETVFRDVVGAAA